MGAARLSRGRSHTRGGHPKAGSCCDIRWGEREGGAHRRGLRAVCDRAEPGPPPEEEAKTAKVSKRPASAPTKVAKAPKVSKAAEAEAATPKAAEAEAAATPAEEVMFYVRISQHQQLLKRSLSDELLKRSVSSFLHV